MWFDFGEFGVSIAVPDDPSIGLAPDLVQRLLGLGRRELKAVAEGVGSAEWPIMQVVSEWSVEATPEGESEFVDRPIRGEAVLSNPPVDIHPYLIGASLHAQILRAPVRWMPDLYECASGFVDDLIAAKRAAKKAAKNAAKAGGSGQPVG